MSNEDFVRFMQRVAAFGRTDVPMVSSPMYERFTDRGRKVMQLAQKEADHLNHEYVGTEHILLGLIKEGSGIGAHVLKNLDIVDLNKIRQEIESIIVRGEVERSGLSALAKAKKPLTLRGKKVLESAIEEARNLKHNYVGTEHILLGLLRVPEGVACQIMNNLGVNFENVREEIMGLLGHYAVEETLETVAKESPSKLAEVRRIINTVSDPLEAVEQIRKLIRE